LKVFQVLQSQSSFDDSSALDRVDDSDQGVWNAVRISRLMAMARRQMVPIVACCLGGIALGVLYLEMAVPLYTASTNIMIDTRQVRAVQEFSTLSDRPTLDTDEEVESQVEVLRSEQIGTTVVKKLDLTKDPAFIESPKSWMNEIEALISIRLGLAMDVAKHGEDTDVARRLELRALETLNRNLRINRVGRTFVIQVDYTSPDAARAAEIANGIASSYLLEQLNSRVEATHRARNWLQQRTEELRLLAVDAGLAAQTFRANNNLLATKGMLVSEQQLNEMTTELDATRTATAQAQARHLRIKNIIEAHQTESAVVESLANPVINDLRTKYLDASKRKTDLERKLGPEHIAVINLRNTMDELSALLFQELGRVAETYKNDYEIAAGREKAMVENLAQQRRIAVTANDAQVPLHQLEQKAESYRTLYQNYLQRDQEAAQQESFPMADAHVIAAASPPLKPSHPKVPLVLAISLVLGASAGAGVGIFRELMDRVFRTVEEVRGELGAEVLGLLPAMQHAYSSPPSKIRSAVVDPNFVMGNIAPILRYSIDHPFSAYAETLRSAKIAADVALHDHSTKIIGVVSLLPDEGKSTIAKNLASLLALEGTRTLLIDADTRSRGLTRGLGCGTREGTQSELCVPPRLAELIKYEAESGLQILPCIYAENDPRVAAGLTATTLQALLQNVGQSYEYVIIDLPPIGPVVNARGIAPAIGAFIFVVAWGTTSRGAVRLVLAKEHSVRKKLLGIILNKVDMEKLDSYEYFGSDGYYYKQYGKYYNTPGRGC
jgi:succinoglycan biosynthesis transport protein ExoP